MKSPVDRRQFLATAAATGAALTLAKSAAAKETRPCWGGRPSAAALPRPARVDDRDEKAMVDVLRSGNWYRAPATWRTIRVGVRQAHGSQALHRHGQRNLLPITSLAALGVGPGDEVIVRRIPSSRP